MSDSEWYWSQEWQADEQIAEDELVRGEGRVFDDPADALRWLSDD